MGGNSTYVAVKTAEENDVFVIIILMFNTMGCFNTLGMSECQKNETIPLKYDSSLPI